ncbi:MAG: hypothetical protein IJH87_03010, partial [Atopobiaceae bacterium]|nr:hypothetical protein [Atopobiaceae bacterium]
FYTDDIRTEERKRFGIRLAAGIALILVGVAFGAFADDISVLAPFSGPLLLVFAAAGVGLIVWAAIMNSRIDIEEYNIDALEDLSEEAIASSVGVERAPEMLRKVKASRLQSTVCAAIMLVATAIALPLMFWATDFGEPFWSRYFWIPWMVGGLLCGVACIIIDARK